MDNIIFNDIDCYQLKKDKLINGTTDKLHVITDFDRTLTNNFIKGRKAPSFIAALRDGQYLSSEYSAKSQALFDHYHPIELDLSIDLIDKKTLMAEWYDKHFELLISSGLNQEKMAQAIDNQLANLRPLVIDFLKLLKKLAIPLLVFSANGLGVSGLKYFFSKRGLMFDNISFLANDFIWGSNNEVLGVRTPIIHPFNKDETMLHYFGLEEKVINRPNILLIGDSLADAHMAHGYPFQNIIKIGFLNDKIRESLEVYNKVYDGLVLNDGDFGLPLEIIKEIINSDNT